MKRTKRWLALLLMLMLAASLLTAGEAETYSRIYAKNNNSNVTGKTLVIYAGRSRGLQAKFSPKPSGSPVWKSSDTSVATVSSSGTVRGIAPGTVTISATWGGRKASVKFTVKRNSVDDITPKPSTSKVKKQYERVWFYLKSVRVTASGGIVAEYYVGNKSSKRLTSIRNLYIEVTITYPGEEPSSDDGFICAREYSKLSVDVPAYGVGLVKLSFPKSCVDRSSIPVLKDAKSRLYAFFYIDG